MTKWHNVYFIYKLWKKKYYSLSSKISDFLTCLSQWDRKTTITMPFYVSTAISWGSSLTYQRMHLLFNSNITSFISREGPTYHSGVSDFTLGFQCDPVGQCLVFFCVMFCRQLFVLLSFSFGNYHTIVPIAIIQRPFYIGCIVLHR
jgi:hypothetical protein